MSIKTFYIVQGTKRVPTDRANLQVEEKLTPATYVVKINGDTGQLYLDMIADFDRPGRIYGTMDATADRILNTFKDRPAGTGVLLDGIKGSGKSMLAKLLSIKAREEMGAPTIVINSALFGEKFNAFIQSIDQPAVILFDEFEKVYDSDEQQEMLTLLDGMYPSKKLFVLTCNDSWRINDHMKNRPGRLFYSLSFNGLSEAEIRDFCSDVLGNKSYTESVVRFSQLFRRFTFDMLKALVEEMNRYNEAPTQAYKMLNVKPNNENEEVRYDVVLTLAGKTLEVHSPTVWHGVPFSDDDDNFSAWAVHFKNPNYTQSKKTKIGGNSYEDEWSDEDLPVDVSANKPLASVTFSADDYWIPGCRQGRHVFRNKDGFEVTLVPKEKRIFTYEGAF